MSSITINGVTKDFRGNQYYYYFDQVTIEANLLTQKAQVFKKFTTELIYTIDFPNLANQEGTANIVEYIDKQALDGKYFGQGNASIVFPSSLDVNVVSNQTDYATETTSSAILLQLQSMAQFNQGFIDYNDASGAVSLIKDTWTSIPNNGQGAFTNKNYKPEGVTELLDETTGKIDVTELDLGDTILIRNDFTVNPNTNNSLLEFRYSLGQSTGSYVLSTNLGRLDNGSGKPYRFALKPDLIYMGDTNTRNNPITLQVKLSSNGTLTNAGTVIQVIKR